MSSHTSFGPREIAQVMGISRQAVSQRATKENWPFDKRPGRGGGKLYPFASLPEDVRAAITLAEVKALPVLQNADGMAIPEKVLETGQARYRLLGEWQTRRRKTKPRAKADRAFLLAYNSGDLLPDLRAILGDVCRATLHRWNKVLDEADGDWRELCDHRGMWSKGGPTGVKLRPEVQEALLDCWLTPQKPSRVLAWRAAKASLEAEGLPFPSLRTAHRFFDQYDRDHHDLVVLKREGEKALHDRVGVYITREGRILEVGDVLVADGHTLNFDSINPLTGRPKRLTLVVWFDWASRLPVGWEIMPSEDTIAVASALMMAIKNLGKYPKIAYLDNGKAFKNKYFGNADARYPILDGAYARMGINVQYSRPYEARTKIVERFFGTFSEQCARLLPSYRGRDISDKPAYLMRNEPYHTSRHNAEAVPTLAETLEILTSYIGWYSQQPHEGLDGRTPLEVFQAGRGPGVDTTELSRMFLWRKTVRPRRCRVTIAGIDYESDAWYGKNRDYVVKYSWADMSRLYIYDEYGRYYGEAKPVEAIHPVAKFLGDDLDMLKVKEANKRQKKLRKQTLDMAKELDGRLEGKGLEALSWVEMATRQKAPLRLVEKAPEPEPVPQVTEEERRSLAEAQDKTRARLAAAPPYERPDDFANPFDRYNHLFKLAIFQGVDLLSEDKSFMASYEASDEFQVTGKRFEQLRKWARVQQEQQRQQESKDK